MRGIGDQGVEVLAGNPDRDIAVLGVEGRAQRVEQGDVVGAVPALVLTPDGADAGAEGFDAAPGAQAARASAADVIVMTCTA
jgi:hypothetical protein